MSNIDRIRENLAALVSTWRTIAEYGEREELIFTSDGLCFYLGMQTAEDGLEPRAASTIAAMNWLRDEINLQTAILNELELAA